MNTKKLQDRTRLLSSFFKSLVHSDDELYDFENCILSNRLKEFEEKANIVYTEGIEVQSSRQKYQSNPNAPFLYKLFKKLPIDRDLNQLIHLTENGSGNASTEFVDLLLLFGRTEQALKVVEQLNLQHDVVSMLESLSVSDVLKGSSLNENAFYRWLALFSVSQKVNPELVPSLLMCCPCLKNLDMLVIAVRRFRYGHPVTIKLHKQFFTHGSSVLREMERIDAICSKPFKELKELLDFENSNTELRYKQRNLIFLYRLSVCMLEKTANLELSEAAVLFHVWFLAIRLDSELAMYFAIDLVSRIHNLPYAADALFIFQVIAKIVFAIFEKKASDDAQITNYDNSLAAVGANTTEKKNLWKRMTPFIHYGKTMRVVIDNGEFENLDEIHAQFDCIFTQLQDFLPLSEDAGQIIIVLSRAFSYVLLGAYKENQLIEHDSLKKLDAAQAQALITIFEIDNGSLLENANLNLLYSSFVADIKKQCSKTYDDTESVKVVVENDTNESASEKPSKLNNTRCYKCYELGHLARECCMKKPETAEGIDETITIKKPKNSRRKIFKRRNVEQRQDQEVNLRVIKVPETNAEIVQSSDDKKWRQNYVPREIRNREFGGGGSGIASEISCAMPSPFNVDIDKQLILHEQYSSVVSSNKESSYTDCYGLRGSRGRNYRRFTPIHGADRRDAQDSTRRRSFSGLPVSNHYNYEFYRKTSSYQANDVMKRSSYDMHHQHEPRYTNHIWRNNYNNKSSRYRYAFSDCASRAISDTFVNSHETVTTPQTISSQKN